MTFSYAFMVNWFWTFVMFFRVTLFVVGDRNLVVFLMLFLFVVSDWNLMNNVWLNMSDFVMNDMWLNRSVVLFTFMMLWDRPENKWLINYLEGDIMNIMLQDRRF